MSIVKVNNENFQQEVIDSDKKVLIDFFAEWCGPCKMLSPIVDKLAQENEDIKVVKINIDEESDLANKYQIMSLYVIVITAVLNLKTPLSSI